MCLAGKNTCAMWPLSTPLCFSPRAWRSKLGHPFASVGMCNSAMCHARCGSPGSHDGSNKGISFALMMNSCILSWYSLTVSCIIWLIKSGGIIGVFKGTHHGRNMIFGWCSLSFCLFLLFHHSYIIAGVLPSFMVSIHASHIYTVLCMSCSSPVNESTWSLILPLISSLSELISAPSCHFLRLPSPFLFSWGCFSSAVAHPWPTMSFWHCVDSVPTLTALCSHSYQTWILHGARS